MPNASLGSNDRTIYKAQVVRVYTPAMVFIDCWRDAPLLAGVKFSLNAATTPIQITLPRPFSNFDLAGQPNSLGTVAQGNIVQYWLYGPGLANTGLLKFQAVIDGYAPQIAENGEESVVITLTPFDSALADRAVAITTTGAGSAPGAPIDPVAMFKFFFNNNDPNLATTAFPKYSGQLTLNAGTASTSGTTAYFTFVNQTLLSVFQDILLMLPANWFFRVNADKSVTLNVPPTTSQHNLYIGQNLVTPQYNQDWSQAFNVIAFQGNIRSLNVVVKGSDVATIGARYLLTQDSRATDNSTSQVLANGLLALHDRAILRVKVRLPDYRGDSNVGLGYDIENLQVGDTCQIIDERIGQTHVLWDKAKWDTDTWDTAVGAGINTVVTIYALTYNWDSVDIELGTPQPSQDRSLYRVEQRFQDYSMSQTTAWGP